MAGPRALALVAALGVLLLSLGASASIAVALPFEEVVRRAELIVEGRVSRVTSRTRAHRGRVLIETHVAIDVSEVHRGEHTTEVRFTLPGGRAGDRTRVVVGTPTFHVHEEVVAFFHERDGALSLVGLAQGLYRVNRLRDGRAFVVRDLRDIALHRGSTLSHGERESMPIGEFRKKLRQALEDRP
jgi:hypothetical protein